ncbi:hypothetical protein PRUB_a3330 [Pseudoalteromonas rubra]|uniref:DUF4145 domain-containing protein n=1 Tax=Pseudoalteromonas rubra TaxID=43658 RepID=A0A8T0C4M5_9GAMM|nr:DUF4145 domain-containing protein [Pseudoalteromonas rubra]KAF7783537.1 hypothetical protein PRUB_a3330 [Pseudoalteromonas rubra]
MSKYVPPTILSSAFNCPHCEAFSNMKWSYTDSYIYHRTERTRIWACRCSCCENDSYWWVLDYDNEGSPCDGYMILPEASSAPMPHPEMPDDVKEDYLEARAIVGTSSRGACALLRLVVQKLCKDLGYTSGNINKDIGSMVSDGLPVQIQQALDVVRVVGNNAVHPGELNKGDVDSVAIAIFHLINEIIEDRISKPKRIAELYEKLPKGAVEAIEKRDS